MARIIFDDVWKRFPDGTEAVRGLNLQIEDGEFVILVGPSGCGKSTALRMVAGLEEVSQGDVVIGDWIVNELSPRERGVAMVFQSYALYPHLTVEENIGFALKVAKAPKDEIRQRVVKAAEILGLTDYLHRKPKQLSGGQRQRVAMGRALVREPKAFLMDEPLSNLDAKLRVQMRAEITELRKRIGITTLYVTHDQVEAMTMGDRVAVLKSGVLQQVDAPSVLYGEPRNLFVATFIGSPSMNVAEAAVRRGEAGYTVELPGTAELGIPDAAIDQYPRVPDYAGKKVAVGLRPEHFEAATGDHPINRRFPSRHVSYVEELGSQVLVHFGTSTVPVVTDEMRHQIEDEAQLDTLMLELEQGAQPFTAQLDPAFTPQMGEQIDIAFKTEKLHFFDLETGEALR